VNNHAPNEVGNTSTQFGYLDNIKVLDSVFTSSDPILQNEHTAMFMVNVDAVIVRQFAPNGDFQLLTIASRRAVPTFKTAIS
jgi:hypothetical protein